ncbi:MAG: hypothetical protein ACRDPY_02635 [Streptosporangiaceae bacterium]
MTGQMVVFAWAVIVLITGWPLIITARWAPAPALGLWTGICAIMLVATVWRPFDPAFYGMQSAIHALWWLIMPPLVMIITWYWTLRTPPERLIRAIADVTAAAMTANAVLALAQLAFSDVTLGGFLPRFWDTASGTIAVPVAELAVGNGRYTGIFDQPAEAGIAYGLALLCVIYLVRRGMRWELAGACAALLVTGGILSLSKAFLFGALPLAAWAIAASSGVRMRILAGCAAGAAAMLLAGSVGLLPSWAAGHNTLESLLHPTGPLASVFTAGRYGPGGGTLGLVAADVLRASPWAGFGAGGLATPYDSLWLQILVLSGIVGLVLMCAALVALVWRWLRLRAVAAPPERSLAGSVLALTVGTSLGFPALTANRVGILAWLILGVLLTGRDSESASSLRGTWSRGRAGATLHGTATGRTPRRFGAIDSRNSAETSAVGERRMVSHKSPG